MDGFEIDGMLTRKKLAIAAVLVVTIALAIAALAWLLKYWLGA